MKLVAVEKVPGVKRGWTHKLQKALEDFANSDLEVVRVELEEGEYKSVSVARNAIARAVKHSKRPIIVFKRGDELYLTKII